MRTLTFVAGVLFLAGGQPARADEPPVGSQTKRVVVGEQFRKGGLHRFLFGADYRDLYTTPVELPVLDLAAYAGGLKPNKRVGHGETKALALRGADGRDYTFRPVLKDPVGLLPAELRETLAASLVRDQMASGHPAGHTLVPTILDAVGILHNVPRLCIMPDDPALGEFQKDFAGLVGDIEEWGGSSGFRQNEEDNIDGGELWKRLKESPEVRVDAKAYLVARLVDHLIGDWDRHRDQWRWAKLPGNPLWQPIPEDRDQAFVRFEGSAVAYLRPQLPLLVDFGPEYPNIEGLTFDGWDVDRRLLSGLEKPDYEAAAAFVHDRITDSVIEDAVGHLPREYYEKDGARLIAGLKARRDHIPEEADRFYRFLAQTVDIFGTDADEEARIDHGPKGELDVTLGLRGSGGDAPPPYFHRRFHPQETSEIRIYLLGGNDRVTTTGRPGQITVRVVGGAGAKSIDDSKGGGTHFYDPGEHDQVKGGPGTQWDRGVYTPPPPKDSGDWIPPRDWGRRWMPITRLTFASDDGLIATVGLQTTGYGFRKDPDADEQSLRAGYGTGAMSFVGQYQGRFHLENSSLVAGIYARGSGLDFIRFFGFGNTTTSTQPDDFYKVKQKQYTFVPSLGFEPSKRFLVAFGPVLKYVVTDSTADKFISLANPYGAGNFGQVGAAASVAVDTTDVRGLPRKGVLLRGGASVYPALWDVVTVFGEAHADATAYLNAPIPLDPTLSLRAGGKRVWGTSFPYYESAFIGGGSGFGSAAIADLGSSAVRGLRPQRYAGDASLYGSAELRLKLANAFLLVPGQVGIFGLADFGRVYLDSEVSNRWHHGVGGGLWFATPGRHNAFYLAVARSEGRTAFYLREALGF
jgi:hypothetical protein